MKPQAVLETERERCPHCHTLLFRGTRQCWVCEKTPEEWAETSDTKEVKVQEQTSTLALESKEAEPECTISISREDGTFTDPISLEEFEKRVEELAERRPNYAVIDRNTGEVQQLSLLGAQWDEYKVESLRLSLSGGGEFIKSMFDELVEGELSPGAIVEVVSRGIVKEHAPVFKRDGHEGKTVILLEVVRRITVLGHMTGKVEAAQNVDGEAKVLEEDCTGDEYCDRGDDGEEAYDGE